MVQSFQRLSHPGDVPHLAVALKRYIGGITDNYFNTRQPGLYR